MSKRAQQQRRRVYVYVVVGVVAVVAVLYGIFQSGTKSGGGATKFATGQPGAGAVAPDIRLASTSGGTFDLSTARGKTVLLYFQEGVGCEPCWKQIKDIEANVGKFRALGIDEMVSVTTNDLAQLKQKAADEGISTPVLSDPEVSVSKTYTANEYGMMGNSMDGHTFIVVGPDGKIRWRADYGGAPNYTMYVPVDPLVAQIRQGLGKA